MNTATKVIRDKMIEKTPLLSNFDLTVKFLNYNYAYNHYIVASLDNEYSSKYTLSDATTLINYGKKTLDVEDEIISLLCSDLLTQLYNDHKISKDDYKSNCIRCNLYNAEILNRSIEKPPVTTEIRNINDMNDIIIEKMIENFRSRAKPDTVLSDTQLLNELDNLGSKDMLWICRESSTGRGLRVHQDPLYGKFNSIREAITDYILSKKK